jgi:O-antigen/teichoic acid export membrane protein
MVVFEAIKNSLKLSLVGKVLRFIGNYLLSWMLFPEDYGVLAVAMASTEAFSLINQIGLQAFYIQDKNSQQEKLFTTVTILDTLLTFSIFLIISIASILSWRNGMNSEISIIMVLMGVNLALTGLSNTRFSHYKKHLDFKSYSNSLISIDILSTLSKLILAYLGWGASSFIIGEILGSIVKFYLCVPFYNKNFSFKFFEKVLLKKISWFGKHSIITGIATYFTISFDKLFLYRITDIIFLGFYNFAFSQTSLLLGFIISPFNDLLFSTYPKIIGDKKKTNIAFAAFHFFVNLILVPFYIFIILNPSIFLNALYSLKWANSAQLFVLFSFQRLIQAFCFPAMPLLVSNGRPDISSKFKVLKAVLVIILCGFAYWIYKDVTVTIEAFIIGNILGDLAQFFYSIYKYQISLFESITNYIKMVLVSIFVCYFVPYFIDFLPLFLNSTRYNSLLIFVVMGMIYLTSIYIFYNQKIRDHLTKIKTL